MDCCLIAQMSCRGARCRGRKLWGGSDYQCMFFIIGLAAYWAIASPMYPAIPQSERAALIALYNATNGADWTNRTNWLKPSGTEDTWYGISTYPGDNHVTHIWLHDNNLTGTLPPELGNFPYLETFSLHQNASVGPSLHRSVTSLSFMI